MCRLLCRCSLEMISSRSFMYCPTLQIWRDGHRAQLGKRALNRRCQYRLVRAPSFWGTPSGAGEHTADPSSSPRRHERKFDGTAADSPQSTQPGDRLRPLPTFRALRRLGRPVSSSLHRHHDLGCLHGHAPLAPNAPGQPRRIPDTEAEKDIVEALRCDRWLGLLIISSSSQETRELA